VTQKPVTTPAQRARWVFAAPESEIRAKLDVGDHKTLYVGNHGRRELESNGELQHAATLAEEALGGVMRDDKGSFVFVATDGDTYRSTEPLGALSRIAPARKEPLASVTTGRAAILGVSPNGLVRSTDYGLTWKPVDYASSKPYGHAASVKLDAKGNGVLLHLPQRLFVTHDDGATWAPLASPPYGAASLVRDGADRIFTLGYYDQRATLGKDALAETKDAPTSIFPGQQTLLRDIPGDVNRSRARMSMMRPQRYEEPQPVRVLAGDRVVEFAVNDGKVMTRSAPLGAALGNAIAQPELDPTAIDRHRFSSWNGELVYLRPPRESDDDATAAPGSTLVRSKDFGTTWKAESSSISGTPSAIVVGPRGWAIVTSKPPKIRPAGKQAFEDVVADPSFEPEAFAFDEARGKVYALADSPSGAIVYEGALDGAKLARARVFLATRASAVAMTIDDRGTLRLFEHHGSGRVTLRSLSATGEEQPPRFLELDEQAQLAFAGRRGLALGNHASYETNDAGDTWTRVASNGAAHELECAAAGCIMNGAQRAGWDLPALQSDEIVRAITTAPSTQPDVAKPKAKPAPISVTCKSSGKGSTTESSAEASWVDGTTAARWAQAPFPMGGTGAVSLTWVDKDTVHRAQLLPAAQSTMELRTGLRETDDGFIAARYQFARRSATGTLNPVRVDLAWWRPNKPNQIAHATLTGLKPFFVSRFGFSGHASLVDGGIVFQGSREDAIHFASDDGKQQTLVPPGFPFSEAIRSGNRWVLTDSDSSVLQLGASDDGGKTWTLHGWALETSHDVDDIETMNGKPLVRAGGARYEIASPVMPDPPAPTMIDAASSATRCDGLVTGSLSSREPIEDGSVITMELGSAKLTANERIVHDTPNGKLCTAVLQLDQGRDVAAYLYADKGGGWSGWSYRERDNKTSVEPLTCK
jgi:hypothetical protein